MCYFNFVNQKPWSPSMGTERITMRKGVSTIVNSKADAPSGGAPPPGEERQDVARIRHFEPQANQEIKDARGKHRHEHFADSEEEGFVAQPTGPPADEEPCR